MEREESIGAQWNQGREKLYKVRRGDWPEGKLPEFATWHLIEVRLSASHRVRGPIHRCWLEQTGHFWAALSILQETL